ncbi:type VI secretion protein, family [Hartmannibacter diazotrophicus]|uniref:Type VI secretion protein, family n=1 Tax=Hartmannibacter diazotrophicus TaxID=1482074 RepID=A0A2C9D6E3_9HYPH|nr:type VI secretion system contractile sheath small subunit [Hartmannibacter diazotrophicus]SON55877.1 type VI secretion protein, family [Hartmannibacter diazotrophicus]
MAKGSQEFIKRNRPPRVQISYKGPEEGDRQIELPFIMGVLSDLSGNASEVEKPPIADRKLSNVDMDNIDDYMKSVQPGTTFKVANKLGGDGGDKLSVKLKFEKMADLEPAAVARQIPSLAKLLAAREQLAHLQRYMDGKVQAEQKLQELLSDKDLLRALSDRAKTAAPVEDGE